MATMAKIVEIFAISTARYGNHNLTATVGQTYCDAKLGSSLSSPLSSLSSSSVSV